MHGYPLDRTWKDKMEEALDELGYGDEDGDVEEEGAGRRKRTKRVKRKSDVKAGPENQEHDEPRDQERDGRDGVDEQGERDGVVVDEEM